MKNEKKKLKNKKSKPRSKTNRIKRQKMTKETIQPEDKTITSSVDPIIEQPISETTETVNNEINEPIQTEIVEDSKPCISCAEKALNKKLNSNYFIAAASIGGLASTTIIYRRGSTKPTLVGISFGVFALLLLNSLIQIGKLHSFKNKLKS